MNASTATAVIAVLLVLVISLYFTVRSFRSGKCSGCCNRRCCQIEEDENTRPRDKN